MSPAVEAALIAGGVGVLTLAGTLLAQFYGIRKSSSDTERTLKRQLAEQREQLDKTLAQQRDRTLNERFATAADRLGSDKPPAVRLAGVYAMAGLADDWPKNRQTCVDILCAYLRLPYDPDPGDATGYQAERAAYRANREVRHTIIRLIGAHLREDVAASWQGLNLDFTGVVFDGADFSFARFSGGIVRFIDAEFSGGVVDFGCTEFSGGVVGFGGARFSGGKVDFSTAKFSGGRIGFGNVEFSGGVVGFRDAEFCGCNVYFGARFSGGKVDFRGARLSGGKVDFNDAAFSGGKVNFNGAKFSGSEVNFREPRDWTEPPMFDWGDSPPAGVMLPAGADAIPG
jgi:uncharacterized protein YjbI with pentapeptide repeats